MVNKGLRSVPSLLALLMCVNTGCPLVEPVSGDYYLEVDSIPRMFRLFVPSSYNETDPMPLVISLHGLMHNGEGSATMTGFEELAEEQGFIVAFPEGVLRSWYAFPEGFDIPLMPELPPPLDTFSDVAFVSALIDALSQTINVDPSRVYVSGASNGGMMSYLLALELSDRIAAAAAIMASMPEAYADQDPPEFPVPMIIMHGTDDPIIPYDGGGLLGLDIVLSLNPKAEPFMDFDFLSAQDTAAYWALHNQTNPTPLVEPLPDLDPADGATAIRTTYTGGSDVVLYTLEGGGHTWPGGPQYLPKLIIGNTCRDIDATRLIWEFFNRYRRH